MKFEIKNRFTNEVQFVSEIEADENTPLGIKIGMAIKWAIKNGSNLSGSNLRGSNLSDSDLSGSNLSGSDLSGSNLSGSNLSGSNLGDSDLRGSNLRDSDLSGSNLRGSNLSGSNLRGSNLRGSNLSDSNLSDSNLSDSDLSGVKSFPKTAAEYFSKFDRDEKGFIVFRSQPGNQKEKPSHWKWEPGEFLTETPNPCRTTECGSGVNFSSLEWARRNYSAPYWKCRIRFEDMADVVVPFYSDGKARCARLELLEVVQ